MPNTITDRIPLEWRKSGLISGNELTQGYLDGVCVGTIHWTGGDHPDGPWGIVVRQLPSRLAPKRKRYPDADAARLAVEQHVNRWLRRMVNAARREGWSV